MLTSSERKVLEDELKQLDTVAQIFNHLGKRFDLENAKLGSIAKKLFIDGAMKGITLVNPKKR